MFSAGADIFVIKTVSNVSFYTTTMAEGGDVLTSNINASFYTTAKADFLTSKLAKRIILHNNRCRMLRCADFKHQCVILYNSKSILFDIKTCQMCHFTQQQGQKFLIC
jgi:hypothetical protein